VNSGSKEIATSGIAIRDIPTGSEPSINGDVCQEIPRSRGSEDRSFRRQRTRATGNHETRYPDRRAVWATTGVSGGQVSPHIGDQEKGSPESIDIRIHDLANPEILTEVLKQEWKIQPTRAHRRIGILEIGGQQGKLFSTA
jgi:hypothetical protein